jgi:ABC-type uncharacterized transport system involved in gliding motility auxiliary subunit
MRTRLLDLLTPLGLLVMAGAFVASRRAVLPGPIEAWLVGGLALIVAHLLLRWEDIARAIGGRQLRYGTNALVFTLIVLGILATANYLVARRTKRWDLTKNQRYSLSDHTKKLLAGLKDDIRIVYFQRTVDVGQGQDRMKDFQAATPRIKVEFVDPIANPARAQAYDARGPYPVLFVERGERRERIANDSEQDVANGIIKVTRSTKKTVCFAEGEGERDPDDSSEAGLSSARSALQKAQYETKKVLLLREKKVPAECTVLVVAGPTKDLLSPSLDAIRQFVQGGGKSLIMVEPEFKEPQPALTSMLKEWNLEAGRDVVVDASGMGQLFGTGPITPIAAQYPYHDITKDMRGVVTLFHAARSVEAGKATIPGVATGNLIETSQASWAESDLALREPVALGDKDRRGPIALGAWATIKAPEPSPAPSPSPSPAAEAEAPAKPEGRLVAMGDSDYASNALLGIQGNQDFFLNTVAWLAQDTDLISIRPKEPEDQRMFLTQNQQLTVAVLALLILPGLAALAGVLAWWVRR